jgi:hypothetical protein
MEISVKHSQSKDILKNSSLLILTLHRLLEKTSLLKVPTAIYTVSKRLYVPNLTF